MADSEQPERDVEMSESQEQEDVVEVGEVEVPMMEVEEQVPETAPAEVVQPVQAAPQVMPPAQPVSDALPQTVLTPPPTPPQGATFIPETVDFASIQNFGTVLRFANQINDDQLAYLTRIAEALRDAQAQSAAYANKLGQIAGIVNDPSVPQAAAQPQTQEPQQNPMIEFLQQLQAMQEEEAKKREAESTRSFLVKQGDADTINEFHDREEAARQPHITAVSAPVSQEKLSREQMEEQRRARYARLQQNADQETRRREEEARKSAVMDAFWKNDGNTNAAPKRP